MSGFVPLHVHTYYSTLDSSASPEEYMKRAKEIGLTHLSISDHGTTSGHRHFQRAAKEAGIIPILGVEAYHTEDMHDRRSAAKRQDGTQVYNHLSIIAKDEGGLSNMNHINKLAWQEGFYFKPRIGKELLFNNSEGLVVMSGCMSGMVAKALLNDDEERAYKIAREHKEVLGDDYYIEVMATNPPALNHALLKIADDLKIKPVMSSDCHYVSKEDLPLEEAILILSTNPKPNFNADISKAQKMDLLERYNYLYPDRRMTFQEIEVYLRDYATEKELFVKQGIERDDIFENTFEIANKVGEYPYHTGLDLLPRPKSDPKEALRKLVFKGLKDRNIDTAEYHARAEEELKVIFDKGFETYFLVMYRVARWTRQNGIRSGYGRGSGGGSLVNYSLGLTQVDPIKYNLLFFRFLDPSRPDWPDLDFDVSDSRREEVKDYIRETFASVAGVSTITFFQGKSSIRDASRVLRVPLKEVNRALKDNDASLVMNESPQYYDWFIATPKGREFNRKYPEVVELARMLHGRLKTFGQHASAIVASKEPIENYVPVETAKRTGSDTERNDIIALDMHEVEDIGFIKLDILGLKALSVVEDTLKYIKDRHGEDIDMLNIPLDDPGVYGDLSRGHTKAVFQCMLPSQPIHTSTGVKSASDIVQGDRVLTHTGRFMPVVRTMRRHSSNEMFKITLAKQYSDAIYLTGEHPVLVSDNAGNAQWVKVEDIQDGKINPTRTRTKNWNSYAVMPKTHTDVNPSFAGYEVDEEWARFLGLYAAEGCFSESGRMIFTFNSNESEYIEFVSELMNSRLGMNVRYRHRGNCTWVIGNAKRYASEFRNAFGIKARAKRVPEFMYGATESSIRAFLSGFAEGDGRILPSGSVGIQVASANLAWGLRSLVTNLGQFTEVKHHVRNLNGVDCDVYSLNYHLGVKTVNRVIDTDEYVLIPIKSVSPHAHEGEVVNFEVEEDNSYVSTFVMHNCEQPAYTGLILEMGGVHSFDELAASNALVRPGAMKTIGKDYIARKNGVEPIVYMHESIRYFTEDTYGLPTLYQEQQMLACVELGGMSMDEANKVRRGLGKKEIDKILPFKEKFIENATEKIGRTKAEKLWSDLEFGAEYNFNKSHSVAYSMLSYAMAWLKHYYPVEFMAATLRNETDTDSITDYLIEAKRLGITVKLPHVNTSGLKAEPEGAKSIRLGLTNIKYCGEKVARSVMLHRPFSNYEELVAKVEERGSGLNKRMLSTMNLVGAASFKDNPKRGDERNHFYDVLKIPAFTRDSLDPRVEHQIIDLADIDDDGVNIIKVMLRKIVKKDTWARAEVLDETGTAGFFTDPNASPETGKEYLMLVSGNALMRAVDLEKVNSDSKNSYIRYLYGKTPELDEGFYYTVAFKPRKTKAGKDMANMVAVDHTGRLLDILVWPSDFESAKHVCANGMTWKYDVKEKEDDEGRISYFLSLDNGPRRFVRSAGASN